MLRRCMRHISEYNYWRRRAIPFAQKLAERISALKGQLYTGCGFHYDLENDIVKMTHLLAELQPYTKNGWGWSIAIQVRLESLAVRVKRAEESAKTWAAEL